MKTISFAIQKGGSGKTTTVINLAATLQQVGRKVLLIDLDPQANLTQALGVRDWPEKTIYDLFRQLAAGQSANLKDILLEQNGLQFAPASLDLAGAELELVSAYGREGFLKKMLAPLRKDFDYIFIDCPPSVAMLTVNAMVASDGIVMPMNAEFFHLKGVESFLSHLEKIKNTLHPDLQLLGIILTKFDARKNMNKEIQATLRERFGAKVFDTTIRVNIAIAKAQEEGMDIFTYDRFSNGAMDYLNLASEFLTKIKA